MTLTGCVGARMRRASHETIAGRPCFEPRRDAHRFTGARKLPRLAGERAQIWRIRFSGRFTLHESSTFFERNELRLVCHAKFGGPGLKQLEIFPLLPLRDLGAIAGDLGLLDAQVIVDEILSEARVETGIRVQ